MNEKDIRLVLFILQSCMVLLTAIVMNIAESIYGKGWQSWTTGAVFIILLLTPVLIMCRKGDDNG